MVSSRAELIHHSERFGTSKQKDSREGGHSVTISVLRSILGISSSLERAFVAQLVRWFGPSKWTAVKSLLDPLRYGSGAPVQRPSPTASCGSNALVRISPLTGDLINDRSTPGGAALDTRGRGSIAGAYYIPG
jgi:hypothetical protein